MNNTKALTDVDISTSFDNIFANNSGTVRQINKATLFEALESAEDYQALKSEVNTLQESVNGIDTTTDTTLTKTGKAADAKTTGDKLAALKEKDDAVDAEIGQLKKDLGNVKERDIEPLNKSVFGSRKLLLATPIDEDWSGCMNEKGEIYSKDKSDRWHKTYRLCSEDTTIKVKDYAGGNIKHCIFLDRSNNVISTTVGAWTQKMLDVSVPSGAKYVVVNATDSADMIVCYTHIFDTDYNVAEKMNDVNIRINSAEATIGNVKESLNSVTDTVFSEKNMHL